MPPRWPAAPWNGVIRSCRPPSRRCGMAACGTGAPMPSNWPARVSWKISRPSCGRPAMQAWILPPCRPWRGAASWRSRGHTAGHRGDGGTLCRRPAHAGAGPGALRAEARGVLATLVVSMFGSQALLAGGSISQQLAAAWKRPRAEPAIRQALCSAGGPRAQCLDLRHARDNLDRCQPVRRHPVGFGDLDGAAAWPGGDEPETADRCDGACRCRIPGARERCIWAWAFPPSGTPCIPPEIRAPPRCWKAWPCQAPMPTWPGRSRRLAGERPNIDFGLAALSAVHRLPSHAPLALFAIGRCVGWLAHALEQPGQGR